jgi:hypothetical protein
MGRGAARAPPQSSRVEEAREPGSEDLSPVCRLAHAQASLEKPPEPRRQTPARRGPAALGLLGVESTCCVADEARMG